MIHAITNQCTARKTNNVLSMASEDSSVLWNQLVQFYHDLVSNLDRALNRDQKQTDVIMDFAKAFDKVPDRRLLYKLKYNGIR